MTSTTDAEHVAPEAVTRHVGEVLAMKRAIEGWSLRDVERRSNGRLKSGYLSQLESGKVSPAVSTLYVAATAYGLGLTDLLDRAGLTSTDQGSDLSPTANRMLHKLRDLPESVQQDIDAYVDMVILKLREDRKKQS
jgi:transcriptional regulator with XRE-family HTH domain